MADPAHLKALKRFTERGGWPLDWRGKVNTDNPDLSHAELGGMNFRGAYLSGVDFTGADLRRANLSGTLLIGAKLAKANLDWADLSGADLSRADLTGADLGWVHLKDALLRRTNLREANLTGADLTRANIHQSLLEGVRVTEAASEDTIWSDLDLRTVIGLDNMRHKGPSTIGINTLYKSHGDIPEAFLRGAGVPDTFITFARSLVGQAIEFYSCFISYSSKDEKFAERLHADLRCKNLRVWFAPEDLKIGDRFQERIEESIRLHDKVMVVLSEASVKSRWVEREINAARDREDREKRTVLFPIRIDNSVMEAQQPWAADIRGTRHIGDFRLWKDHDAYEKAFERLLRDLKAEAGMDASTKIPPKGGGETK